MADQKISQLTDGGASQATDEYVIARSGSNFRIDGASVAAAATSIGTLTSLTVTGTATFGTVAGTTITEGGSAIVRQTDIGSAPNEVPLNQYLGAMAYVDTPFVTVVGGAGITTGTNTVARGSFALEGGIRLMRVLIDLRGLNSGGTANDIIGVNGTALRCYIAQIPSMTVLGGRMTCLEAPAGGDTDIDLYSATEDTGVEDQPITDLTETLLINAGTQSLGTLTYLAANPAAGTYLYLAGQGTANATYTAGRFLIELFGV